MRDLHRCAVTGTYDVINSPSNTPRPSGTLVCTCIVPYQTSNNTLAQHLVCVFTDDTINLARQRIDDLSNTIFLSKSITGSFCDFQWFIKLSQSIFTVECIVSCQVHDIEKLPEISVIHIEHNEISLQIQSLNADLCCLHFTVSQILETSGAVPMLLRYHCAGNSSERCARVSSGGISRWRWTNRGS